MKTLKDFITELTLNEANKSQKYNYHPKTKDELKELLEDLLGDRGKDADLNDIDVSKITDMEDLFIDLFIRNIDISEWDVSNVKNMSGMFAYCYKFNSDLSKWDVSNVENTASMFANCYKFNSDLSKWNVSKVKHMYDMFYGCDSLKNKPSWYVNK